MIEQTEEEFGLDEALRERSFSQIPYSDEARRKLGYTEWRRRDPLGNEHYVID